jgi:1,4-dihydroxy-2-naphthoate octaprenyltransferase
MKRSARVTVVTIVVGAILFGLARAVWSYTQVQPLALILTFLALLIAIGLDTLSYGSSEN